MHALAACAQADQLKNIPELSLPVADKKMVIAHCMTNIIRYKGHKLEDSCNPDYYAPTGNITQSLGGLTQVYVTSDKLLQNASLDEAVEFEMRAAIKSGIDGFQFYYTLGNTDWDDIIKAYLRVATKKNIDFKFTFCISHPYGSTETEKIAEFAKRINSIMAEAGHDNKHWLRTPDGRLFIYMWYGEALADVPANAPKPEAYYVAHAYKRLADAVHEKFACIYSINEEITPKKLDDYLDYFPATWVWTLAYTDHYAGWRIAETCKKRNRTFMGSTFADFYTSKLLKKGTWDMFHYAEEAVKAGIPNVERKYMITGLSYNFRKLWEFGIQQNVSVMNIITWNDYPEGHHIAPEINHNDGFAVLLNQYKSMWKEEASPYANKDVAVVFFKKYNHTLQPDPYNIKVVNFQEGALPASSEDSVEVVAILQAPGMICVKNTQINAPFGLSSHKFAAASGAVNVAVKRGSAVVAEVNPPEWITDKPYRSDRITYALSSEYEAFARDLFGDMPLATSHEYNEKYTERSTKK